MAKRAIVARIILEQLINYQRAISGILTPIYRLKIPSPTAPLHCAEVDLHPPVGAGLPAMASDQALRCTLTHRDRRQAGSYR